MLNRCSAQGHGTMQFFMSGTVSQIKAKISTSQKLKFLTVQLMDLHQMLYTGYMY